MRRTTTILIMVLVGLVAYQSHALQANPGRPAVARTVNLTELFDALDERAAKDQELTELARQFKARAETLSSQIKRLEEDQEAFPKGSESYEKAQQQWQLASFDYAAEIEWARHQLEGKRAAIYRKIYLSIKEAAKILAQQQGYDIVFVDDSKEELPDGTEQEVRRQISARRMLYVSAEIDVTSDLAELMNRLHRQP